MMSRVGKGLYSVSSASATTTTAGAAAAAALSESPAPLTKSPQAERSCLLR